MLPIEVDGVEYRYRATDLHEGTVEVEVWSRVGGGKTWHRHRIDVLPRRARSDVELVKAVLANGARDITNEVVGWTAPAPGVVEVWQGGTKQASFAVVAGDQATVMSKPRTLRARWRFGQSTAIEIADKRVWFRH